MLTIVNTQTAGVNHGVGREVPMEYEVVIMVRRKDNPSVSLRTRILGECKGYLLALECLRVIADLLTERRAAE